MEAYANLAYLQPGSVSLHNGDYKKVEHLVRHRAVVLFNRKAHALVVCNRPYFGYLLVAVHSARGGFYIVFGYIRGGLYIEFGRRGAFADISSLSILEYSS